MQDALKAQGQVHGGIRQAQRPTGRSDGAQDRRGPAGQTRSDSRATSSKIEKSIPYLGVFLRTLVGLSGWCGLVVMTRMYMTSRSGPRDRHPKGVGASRANVGEIVKEAVSSASRRRRRLAFVPRDTGSRAPTPACEYSCSRGPAPRSSAARRPWARSTGRPRPQPRRREARQEENAEDE